MYDNVIDQGDLTITDIAGALRVPAADVEGFFGPNPNAEYKVWYDTDTRLGDYAEWFGEYSGIYAYNISRGYEKFQIAGSLIPESLVEAWDKVWDEAHDIDYTERVMARYAALFGYTVRTVSLYGSCQGDWAECVIFEVAKEQGTVNESFVEDLFAGRVFTVEVSLEGPGGECVTKDISGIVGYDDVDPIISDMILEAYQEIVWERAA